jgi:hypothetical protein
MKNILILVLVLATAALAALCVVQSRKANQQQAQVAEQRTALEQTNKALAALQQAQEREEQQRRELLRQSDALVAQERAQKAAVSNQLAAKLASAATAADGSGSEKEQSGFGNMFSKMMEDPDTKKLIQQTQRIMMDQLYGPLIKQLNLTPEEADKFKQLLADNAMKATEQATSMFGGAGSTNHTQVVSQMTEMEKNFDDQMKGLLGDARYEQYKEYQKTAGERTQLNQFKQQLGGDHPLSDQQTEQLLAIMHDEQQKVATATGLPAEGADKKAAEFEMMFSEEKLQAFFDNQAQANQRAYDRAKEVLTPEQLTAYGQFQTNQAQMMRMGMTMAQKMFGSDKAKSGSTPAGQ